MNLSELEKEYQSLASLGNQFVAELTRQLDELLKQQNISLGFPIQQRVKQWKSIAEKVERRGLQINSIKDIPDLIGLRMILLFQRDVSAVCEIIRSNFRVLQQENTQERLAAGEFGYASVHFLIEPPLEWLRIPTLKKVGSFKTEIQVRTVAQHIWAEASHVLQYKQEASVPPPVRRAISRVSALLETVDLEFERVLEQRASYVSQAKNIPDSAVLDVDLLAKVLDEFWPLGNRDEGDDYSSLLSELFSVNVNTPHQLRILLEKTKSAAMEDEKERVERYEVTGDISGGTRERLGRGVYFSHVGLTRMALKHELGDRWFDTQVAKQIRVKK
jgi:putative GTP pyrophosphokinase